MTACKRVWGVALALWAGAAAAPAFAGEIQASSYAVLNGGVNAHVSYAGMAALQNEYVGAGAISLTYKTYANGVSSGPAQALQVWCTDLFDALYTPAVYDVGLLATDHGATGNALSARVGDEINALISHGTALLSQSPSRQVSSAIQLAIWSVEYGSSFTFTSDDGSVAGLVASYIGDVTGPDPIWQPDRTMAVAQITSPSGVATASQGLSYLVPVPEPASALAFISGLIGMAVARRRVCSPDLAAA